MIDTFDFTDDMECPVTCARCGAWVELEECRHAPGCTRCRVNGVCDNLICDACYAKEMYGEDE